MSTWTASPTKRRPRLEVPSAEGDAQLKLRVAFAELLEIWRVNGGKATHEKKQLGGFQSSGGTPKSSSRHGRFFQAMRFSKGDPP